MKLQPIAELNRLGLDTPEAKFKYSVETLKGGTLPNLTPTVIKAAVPAVPAIIGNGTVAAPQFPAVAAKKSILSPVVRPIPDWIGSIMTENIIDPVSNAKVLHTILYLPYSPAAIALGAELDVKQIQQITSNGFDLGIYQGDLSGVIPVAEQSLIVAGLPATLEQYCYHNALLLNPIAGFDNKIEQTIYKPHPLHPGIPVIKIDVYILDQQAGGGGTDTM